MFVIYLVFAPRARNYHADPPGRLGSLWNHCCMFCAACLETSLLNSRVGKWTCPNGMLKLQSESSGLLQRSCLFLPGTDGLAQMECIW